MPGRKRVVSDDLSSSEIDNQYGSTLQSSTTVKVEPITDNDEENVPVAKRRKISRRGRPRKNQNSAVYCDSDDCIPLHIKTRRDQLAGALRLPPDYADVAFSEDEMLGSLEERPQFSVNVKPSRPYKDIELVDSGGLIPASIAQYLRDYQIKGVQFLHKHFVRQTGCLLGDDMGLGKTVQVIAFLTAAFGKSGDERDSKRCRKMRREHPNGWYPRALIVCPGSIIQNWVNELNTWGWWTADIYHGASSPRAEVLQSAKAGHTEVVITTYNTYALYCDKLNTVVWDVVIADECHRIKDKSSKISATMNEVNALCRIGLTGTAIQNRYEEFWNLLNWTNPGRFGTASDWKNHICDPLKIGQSHQATPQQVGMARDIAQKLVLNVLPPFFLRRLKTSHIADQLPKKSDRVVFCPLADSQRQAYENFCNSSLVDQMRRSGEPCDCTNGKKTKRGWCCYKTLPSGNPWQAFLFPALVTLQKLSSHLTLLSPSTTDPKEKQLKQEEILKICLPNDWKQLLNQRDNIVVKARPEYCGKWTILKKLLRFWHRHGDKVLIFSHSVKLLQIFRYLLQNTVYSTCYLDGTLTYRERQMVVDDFNSDPSKFVFLISTKAGGEGLNITSANKVVILDPHWNPSYDLQAQDRAYRIGQTRDVDVFRLVSVGTIEEIIYARQIYKQQQANIGYTASSERRYFEGVQRDSSRKGEIFGLENLLKYQGMAVLQHIVHKTNVAEAKVGIALAEVDIGEAVQDSTSLLPTVNKQKYADEDGGLGQLATFLTLSELNPTAKPQQDRGTIDDTKADPIQAILMSAGVEYTHENSEVIGSSKVEEQISRHALLTSTDSLSAAPHGKNTWERAFNAAKHKTGSKYQYNPPEDVMKRQFCTMAKEFRYANATAFALAVESWSQEQRRDCLDQFYRLRKAKLQATGTFHALLEENTDGATASGGSTAGSVVEIDVAAEDVPNAVTQIRSSEVLAAVNTNAKARADIESLAINLTADSEISTGNTNGKLIHAGVDETTDASDDEPLRVTAKPKDKIEQSAKIENQHNDVSTFTAHDRLGGESTSKTAAGVETTALTARHDHTKSAVVVGALLLRDVVSTPSTVDDDEDDAETTEL